MSFSKCPKHERLQAALGGCNNKDFVIRVRYLTRAKPALWLGAWQFYVRPGIVRVRILCFWAQGIKSIPSTDAKVLCLASHLPYGTFDRVHPGT